jgi:hypothetical protein
MVEPLLAARAKDEMCLLPQFANRHGLIVLGSILGRGFRR